MPNWYTTTIIAKGSEVDLDRIVSTHIVPSDMRDARPAWEDRMFDLNTVIPVPEAIKSTRHYRAYYELSPDKDALGSGYDQSDWYKWARANWYGETWTKKLGVERKPGELTIEFTTRWSPPLPVLCKLREMYPSVHFRFWGFDYVNHSYDDSGGEVLMECICSDCVEEATK